MQNAIARLTIITLGVADMRASIRFYEALGLERKMHATGEEVAFFHTGASVLALYPWHKLAGEAGVIDQPRSQTFRGVVLAWNCSSRAEVDVGMAHALACGGKLIKLAQPTEYGGYCGYFADPDDHTWEVVTAPGITVTEDGRVTLPD